MVYSPNDWDELYYRRPEQLRRIADSSDPALVVRAAKVIRQGLRVARVDSSGR